MLVRKVRGEDKVGKIIVSRIEFDVAKRMGISIEKWVATQLVHIAKKRRWKWYFKQKENA
jgi:hypothetical protein